MERLARTDRFEVELRQKLIKQVERDRSLKVKHSTVDRKSEGSSPSGPAIVILEGCGCQARRASKAAVIVEQRKMLASLRSEKDLIFGNYQSRKAAHEEAIMMLEFVTRQRDELEEKLRELEEKYKDIPSPSINTKRRIAL